ncbi:ABC transporter permease, partial [Patulibacter brassicae]
MATSAYGRGMAVRARDGWEWVQDTSFFAWQVLRGCVSPKAWVTYRSEVLRQASILVSGSVIIVLGLVFALGLVIGIQGAYAAQQVGTPSVAGAFAAIADLREIGPYAFGYMMAAKVSTG